MRKHKKYPTLCACLLVYAGLFGMLLLYFLWDAKHIQQISANLNNKPGTGVVLGITHKNVTAPVSDPYYFRHIIFAGDTATLQNIQLYYGGKTITIPKAKLKPFDTAGITIVPSLLPASGSCKYFTLSAGLLQTHSALPVFKQFINWRGDGFLLQKILLHPLLLFYLLCLALLYLYRRPVTGNPQPATGNPQPPTLPYHLAAAALFILFAAVLLISNPYYFLQDDNYAQFTPVIVNGLDGWYQQGDLPAFNAYQLAGVPTHAYSTYAFFYPGTHFSYSMAKYLLHDVYQFNNVFALLHFALGYYFTYRLLLRLQLHPALAITGALAFVFCGFNLVAVRSWYYVAPTVAFLPAIFYLCFPGKAEPRFWRKWLLPVFLFTLYAYSGNFQYWVYTFAFFGAFRLWWAFREKRLWHGIVYLAVIFVCSIILFLPQLLATAYETRQLPRAGGEGQGILPGMGALLFPFAGNGNLPNGWGRYDLHAFDAFFYFGGFLFLLLALGAWVFRLVYKRLPLVSGEPFAATRIFLLLFLLAFILALGRSGLLWWALAKLPVLNKFNHPFKFLLFVQFFGIVGGAVIFQQLLYRLKKWPQTVWAAGSAIILCGIALWVLLQNKQAFYVYAYEKPYTRPAALLHTINRPLKDYRVVPVGPVRSPDFGFESSLQMNFAMLFEQPSIDGYEPLNAYGINVHEHHREFGIRYFIESHHRPEPNGFPPQNGRIGQFKHFSEFRKISETPQYTVYEDTLYQPVVQLTDVQGNRIQPRNIAYRNNGMDIVLAQRTTVAKLKLSLLYRTGITIRYDGNSPEIIYTDALNRMQCNDIRPVSVIRVRFKDYFCRLL